jgi:hypothetical protein
MHHTCIHAAAEANPIHPDAIQHDDHVGLSPPRAPALHEQPRYCGRRRVDRDALWQAVACQNYEHDDQ